MSSPEEILKKSLEDLKNVFVSQLDDKVGDLNVAWDGIRKNGWTHDSISSLRILVHSMCGTAGTFGFTTLSDSARKLDQYLGVVLDNIDELSPDYVHETSLYLEEILDQIRVLQSGDQVADDDGDVTNNSQQAPLCNKILIIVSDTEMAQQLAEHLGDELHETRTLDSPAKLLAIANEFKPQVIVTNMEFPEGELAGVEAITTLRENGINIPVVYLSDNGDMQSRLHAYRTGSAEYLEAPFDPEEIASVVKGICVSEQHSAYRVLIVDDEALQADAHAVMLRSRGMQVETLTDPMRTLEVIDVFKPELVLMDINMPECSGLEAAAILRQMPRYDTMPIVFLTSEQRVYKKIAAMNLGGDDFLVKPVTHDYLIQAVKARIIRTRHLKKAQESLQRTIDKLSIAKENAEEANRTKTEFVSKISHELRTPLNSMLGFAQLLEMDPDKRLSEQQQESVSQILNSGWHLLALINDILDMSRIESGRLLLQPKKISLNAIVKQSVKMNSQSAADRDIKIKSAVNSDSPCYVYADPTRLQQVIVNFLSNAIKYNRDEGDIELLFESDNDMVKLSVIDTGCGFSEENMSQLFTPFSRLGMEGSSVKGIGIGLAISQRLVELMQGEIGAFNNDKEGATFWFTIRKYNDKTAQEELENTRPAILCIHEDTGDMRAMNQVLAGQKQYRVITVCDAQSALDTARTHHPCLILMDTEMATMDGPSLYGALRAMPHLKEVPVIALSAPGNTEIMQLVENGGFFSRVDKPCPADKVMAQVSAALT